MRPNKEFHRKYNICFILKSTFYSIVRARWITVLSLLIVIVLVGSMCLFTILQTHYVKLSETIRIPASSTGFTSTALFKIEDLSFTDVEFYQSSLTVNVNKTINQLVLYITNDVNRFLEYSNKSLVNEIDFFLDLDSTKVLIGNGLAEHLNIGVGDYIYIIGTRQEMDIYTLFQSEEIREILNISEYQVGDKIENALANSYLPFKVIDVLYFYDNNLSYELIAPLSFAIEEMNGFYFPQGIERQPIIIEFSEINLVDNEKIDLFRDSMEELKEISIRDGSFGADYFINTSEFDSINRTRNLIEQLYPIAIVVAILLGVITQSWIVMLATKDSALHRMFGLSKKDTILLILLRQIIISCLGILCVILGLIFFNSFLFFENMSLIVFCIIIYFFSCTMGNFLTSFYITNKRIIDLLQVKE